MEKVFIVFIASFLSLICGFITRMGWEFLVSGRMKNRPDFTTIQECENHRSKCCIKTVKRQAAETSKELAEHKANTEARLNSVDKRLDQGSKDFRSMRDDISEIKTNSAETRTLLDVNNKLLEQVLTGREGGGIQSRQQVRI